jgi:hypothetical protein
VKSSSESGGFLRGWSLRCHLAFLGIYGKSQDDISSHSLPTRLVSVAALLRCYSPSLTLYSGCSVTFLLSLLVTNHNLLIIRFCRVKVVNPTQLYSGGPSRLLVNPNGTPSKMRLSNLEVDFFSIFHRTILSTPSTEVAISCYYISKSSHKLLRTPFVIAKQSVVD